MKTIVVFNLKGGVGKTTTTVNVAFNFAQEGKRVLVLDLDPQTNTTPFFTKANDNGRTIRQVLEQPLKIKTSICKSKYSHIDIVKGSTLLREAEASDPYAIKEALQYIECYDYCVIDCRPTFESLTLNALNAADIVLTPIQLDGFCRDNLREVSSILDMIENTGYQWKIFVNRIRNTKSQRAIYQDLMECHNYPILDTCISERASVSNSVYLRKPLAKHNKNNAATKDFLDLTEELEV